MTFKKIQSTLFTCEMMMMVVVVPYRKTGAVEEEPSCFLPQCFSRCEPQWVSAAWVNCASTSSNNIYYVNQHRCSDKLSPWVHLHPEQQLPLLLPFAVLPIPSGALTVPPRGRGIVFFSAGGREAECPLAVPHNPPSSPSTPTPSPLPCLFMPFLPSAPPWGRWQPSTVKG